MYEIISPMTRSICFWPIMTQTLTLSVLNYICCITICCGLSLFKFLDLNVKLTLYRKKSKLTTCKMSFFPTVNQNYTQTVLAHNKRKVVLKLMQEQTAIDERMHKDK